MKQISADTIKQIEGLADELQKIAIENEIAVIDVWSVGGNVRFIIDEYHQQGKVYPHISRHKTDAGTWQGSES